MAEGKERPGMNLRKERSFKTQLNAVVLSIAIPLAILLICSSVYSIKVFNEKLADSNQRTVDTCIVQIEKDLSAVDGVLKAVVADSSDFITLSGGTATRLQAYLASLALYDQLKTVMPAYSCVGAFFIYSEPSAMERDMFASGFHYAEKREIQAYVRKVAEENSITANMGWRWAEIGGEAYLFRFFGGRSTYLAAMVPLNKLLDISEWKLEKEAVAMVSTLDHRPLTQREFVEEKQISLEGDYNGYFLSGSPERYMVIGRDIGNTDCRLVFLVGSVGYWDSMTPMQATLLVLSLLAVAVIPLLLIWINRSMIAPVEEIKRTMERIREGDLEAQAPTQGQVPEFRQMNETFNTMMGQIRELKIAAYEKEIETQKAELRYLQLQIRPHFFLNCLKSLYALAQQREYDKIQHMILDFSRHIRYIFRDSMEFVPLERELEHVQNYMDIQRISAVYPPVCTIDADPRLLELLIPPLTIQTFVENSVKHETDPDHALEIEIKAAVLQSGGEVYADLIVSDNGSGFPEEVLEQINKSESSVYAEHHVGLNNVKKRLRLVYGEGVMFAFFNSGQGSVSEILIPLKEEELSALKIGRSGAESEDSCGKQEE